MTSGPRIPLPEPGSLDAEQRAVHDAIAAGPRGRVRGPTQIWLHSPRLADRAQRLGEFLRWETVFEPRLAELAILATARHCTAHYVWFNHRGPALAAGLAAETVEAIAQRRRPAFAREDEAAVHAFVTETLEHHRIADATLARVTALFGPRGAVELGALVGYYVMGIIALETARPPLPDGSHACLPE
ncbi:carboxymuconolactone decarboxylase family protein [Azospirillum sp. ST 5-10]|uniref:carboxymuconolactone decarboxylase family protein n=1 Tax=unclassified Azospirillum TaxID=2630922 RepID=UPI003F4A6B80